MVPRCWRTVARLKTRQVVGVVSPGAKAVSAAFAPYPTISGQAASGTRPAKGRGALKDHRGPVLVVFGADAAAW